MAIQDGSELENRILRQTRALAEAKNELARANGIGFEQKYAEKIFEVFSAPSKPSGL